MYSLIDRLSKQSEISGTIVSVLRDMSVRTYRICVYTTDGDLPNTIRALMPTRLSTAWDKWNQGERIAEHRSRVNWTHSIEKKVPTFFRYSCYQRMRNVARRLAFPRAELFGCQVYALRDVSLETCSEKRFFHREPTGSNFLKSVQRVANTRPNELFPPRHILLTLSLTFVWFFITTNLLRSSNIIYIWHSFVCINHKLLYLLYKSLVIKLLI